MCKIVYTVCNLQKIYIITIITITKLSFYFENHIIKLEENTVQYSAEYCTYYLFLELGRIQLIVCSEIFRNSYLVDVQNDPVLLCPAVVRLLHGGP